jgi:hypothetical protein
MNTCFEEIIAKVEPIADRSYGLKYRCALTLKDGTFLPCAVLLSKSRLVELAKRRIKEEMRGKGSLSAPDPYGRIVSTFVSSANNIADYSVRSASESKYAPPLSLLSQIHGETFMAWTGWVFRMKDGALFSYGSPFNMEFLQLPEEYDFKDVAEVINHSYVDKNGLVSSLRSGPAPVGYVDSVLRERIFFTCAVDGII